VPVLLLARLRPSVQMLVQMDFNFYDLNRCLFLTPMSYQLVTLTDTLQEQNKFQAQPRSVRKKPESVSLSAEILTLADLGEAPGGTPANRR
jgi:hypothetical protein